jgi:hypothetical protein
MQIFFAKFKFFFEIPVTPKNETKFFSQVKCFFEIAVPLLNFEFRKKNLNLEIFLFSVNKKKVKEEEESDTAECGARHGRAHVLDVFGSRVGRGRGGGIRDSRTRVSD